MKDKTKQTVKLLITDEQIRNATVAKAFNAASAFMGSKDVRAQLFGQAVGKGVQKMGEGVAAAGKKAVAMASPQGQALVKAKFTHKKKDNLHDQWIDFKYWLKLWGASLDMMKGAPLEMYNAMLDYPWIIDMLKTSHMRKVMTEGRAGYSIEAISEVLVEETKSTVQMLRNIVLDPDETVIMHVMIPSEILQAMHLKNFTMETAADIVGMVDQHAVEKYLDAMYAEGVPDNTCSYSTITPGIWTMGEMPRKAACIVTTNLPCEAHAEGYSMMVKESGLPTYWLDVPYNFKTEEGGVDTYVKDLYGLIAFLEQHTGHTMDWDELRAACERHNELIKMERERWELNRAALPPMTGDLVWQAHAQGLSLDASTERDIVLFKKLRRMGLENYYSKVPAIKNQRYRVVQWSTPAFMYSGLYTWLERCWGITIVNDMETYGDLHEIDTSTPDTMLYGLATYWCDASMARHMRGKAENWIEGLEEMVAYYKPDFVVNYNHLNCRGYLSLAGFFKDWSRENDMPVCNVDYNFFDPRVVSRQGIRDQINRFMQDVMHAEPLDPSLLNFDDSKDW